MARASYRENIQQKMQTVHSELSKLQSSIWEKSKTSSDDDFNINDMDEDLLQNLIQKDVDKV